MRRRTFGVAVLGLALLCASAAFPADDILKVIPETSLAAVVTQNAEEAEKHIHAVVEKIDSSVSKESLVEALLCEFKLRPRKPTGDPGVAAPAAGTSTIDLAGPFALVLVSSPEDAPGIPVAVVVKVRNYKDLLRELATVVGAAAPGVTADGIDLLKGHKQSLFALSSGDYAVVADAEYVVKTFRTAAEKNLAAADFPELRKACETSDVAIYHNVDAVAKRYADDIEMYKQAAVEQVKNPPNDQPLMMDPEKAARSFGVLADRLVKSWSEMDAILWGLTFRDEGVTASARVRPVGESAFARLVARMKPGRPGIVEFLGGPSVASAAWSVEPELLKDMIAPLDEILSKIEPTDKRNGKKSFVECLKKLMDAATGSGTYVWSPPGEEKGMVRCTCLIPLKPDTDVSGIVKDLVDSSTDLLNACGGPVRTRTKFEEGVETYRDCRIDKITDTFQQNPDAPAPLNPNVSVLKWVEAVYGTELVIYVTRAHDVLVCTIGYPATDTLKAQADRVLDNKHGDLVGSADYQSALKGLPAERGVESVFSLATLLRFASAEDSLMAGKDRQETMRQIKFDRPAGIGMTVAPAEKCVAVDLNVSIPEMQDIREFVLELKRQAAQKQPPKPKDPPKPFGAAGK